MENVDLKYFKQLIKYSDLITTILHLLIIPAISVIIWGIIVILYQKTGMGDLLSPLLGTFLIMFPICILFILGIYFAIKFSVAKNKVFNQDYSNISIDKNTINDNLNKVNLNITIQSISNLLGLDETNIGATINSLTFFNTLKLISKNNKILTGNKGILTDKEKNANNIIKFLIISTILIFSIFHITITLISCQKNKNEIQNTINTLNTIIENDFSDYQLHSYNGQVKITLKNFDSYGRDYYIENNNYRISFELNHKAQIQEFLFEISYNSNDILNEKDIYNILKTLKNNFDNSFSNYYSLKDYASSEILLNEECSNIINNRISDTINLDEFNINKSLRYFSIKSLNEDIKVSYAYRSYTE